MSRRIYKIAIGDWSYDGHNQSDTFVVSVPAQFTDEQLRNNYLANVTSIGLDLTKLFQDYEQMTIDHYELLLLRAAGYDGKFTSDSWDESESEYHNYYLDGGPRQLVDLAMFYIGRGLEGFDWHFENEDVPYLFGKGSASICSRESLGYGLYS